MNMGMTIAVTSKKKFTTGKPVKVIPHVAGETTVTTLPPGVYIVVFGNSERQKILVY
jgi:hypothetical protein